ncbi:hypothetical protein LCGC14_2456570 [marine sediment metagenome]|uniref:Uncharacterized protein n=1 Tax=marine sediment metagenome TaxID=412755 RepID=A0A0F9E8D8_9ZZZZ
MNEFVSKLVNLTYCSTEYAVAAWETLTDSDREQPRQAAKDYANKHNLDI